jgi:hypothetical protein
MLRWILVFSTVIALTACGTKKGTTDGEVRGGLYPMATMAGYGFIDSTGRVVIEPQFTQVTDVWVDGLMSVSLGELFGLVDANGHVVLPPTQVRQVFPEVAFRNGLARAETDTGLGFINRHGDFVIPAMFSNTYGFNEGVAPVRDFNKRWGYIDTTGTWVIEPQFDEVTPFTDGLAVFERDRKWGIINRSGRILLEDHPHPLVPFSKGIVRFSPRSEGWGLIDTTGRVVMPKGHRIVELPVGPLARFAVGELWGVVNTDGKVVADAIYSAVKFTPQSNIWVTTTDGLWGLMDRDGNWILRPQFDLVSLNLREAVWYKKDNRWGLVTLEGKILTEPKFAHVKMFTEGVAGVTVDGNLWGVIDSTGTMITEPKFEWIGPFHEGLAWFNVDGVENEYGVYDGGKWGYTDKYGNVVIEPVPYDRVGNFSSGMAPVKLHDLWGAIDKTGRVIIEPFHDNLEIYGDLIRVRDRKAGIFETGYLNRYGQWVWSPEQSKTYVSPSVPSGR